MNKQPIIRVVEAPVVPQHFRAPSARDLRAQAVQRLQAGLFGLAIILLMVGLAGIINERARVGEAQSNPASGAAVTQAQKSDPLADIGVVPSAAPEGAIAASAAPAPGKHN